MEKIAIAIIGGGASGLFLANALYAAEETHNQTIAVFERGERLGRKLSSTGNGQGNVSNRLVNEAEYFTANPEIFSRLRLSNPHFTAEKITAYFSGQGVSLLTDERGRMYPTGRQASALTDSLRFPLEEGISLRLKTQVTDVEKVQGGFILRYATESMQGECFAQTVVLCTGGKAAKNFGTDGFGYTLAQKLSHTVTPLYPSLVQIKTDTQYIKTLKGIRVTDGALTASFSGKTHTERGDIIFTDYGISGDAVFRISAFITDKIDRENVTLSVDILPDFTVEEIEKLLYQKRNVYQNLPHSELLFGIVNNQIGRAIASRAKGDIPTMARLVKGFTLTAKGTLGFDYAQVTKGGIPLVEVDEHLQSKYYNSLYFAGEILDVDGQCGGFNLHWAYASAMRVAESICTSYKGK